MTNKTSRTISFNLFVLAEAMKVSAKDGIGLSELINEAVKSYLEGRGAKFDPELMK